MPPSEAIQDNDLPSTENPNHKIVIQNPLMRFQSSSCIYSTGVPDLGLATARNRASGVLRT